MISGNIRESCGKNESFRARKNGKIPAVIYGAHKENLNVEIGAMDVISAIRKNGEHTILELNIDGRSERVMVKELQKDPINHMPLHLDLQRIEMGQKIRTRVPVVIKGDKSFKNSTEYVQVQQPEIEIECTTDNLPKYITADVSGMSYGDKINLCELKVPDGVNIIGNPSSTVVLIVKSSGNTEAAPETEETPAAYA